MKSTSHCVGCRNHFYNGNNGIGVKQCFSLKTARVVKRWRIGWWTSPVAPGAFTEVKTYDCHHEPGTAAFSESLPAHAVEPVRLVRARLAKAVTP